MLGLTCWVSPSLIGVALELNAIVDSISPLAARAGQPRLPTSKRDSPLEVHKQQHRLSVSAAV